MPAPTMAISAESVTRSPYHPSRIEPLSTICFLVCYSVRSGPIATMYDYGFFSYESKDDFLDRSREFWNPDKTDFWQDAGVDLVIDRREGYFFWDMAGRRLIDLHLNGGTYNLGHRNPELIATLEQAMQRFDIGNHHFPALARTALAEALVKTCPPNMRRVVYGAGGGEATDIAIKTARHTRQRRKIVSILKGYHGHTGLAVASGDDRFSRLFLSDRPDEFVQVPFNDLEAMEGALRDGDVAAVLLETIPATYGFPLPEPGYLQGVKRLCERHGALYIADEVQTGLMRTGEMWGITKSGVEPDIMVIGKGITGGMYPISCVVVSEECSAWLKEDGFGHISTGGGAELGCVVALKVLEICGRPEVRSMVHYISDRFGRGLRRIQELYPDWFVGIRQDGVVMGLEFDHPQGAKIVMKHLYENGVWAIFSTLDPRVLQFKPGILLGPELVDEVLDRTEVLDRPGARRAARRPRRRWGRDERRRRRAGRRSPGADDAPARPLGGHGVCRLRPRAHPSHRRRPWPTRHTETPKGMPNGPCARPGWASSSTSGARTRPAPRACSSGTAATTT